MQVYPKHVSGHPSATPGPHLDYADLTEAWSPREVEPCRAPAAEREMLMTADVFNARITQS